MATVKRRRFTPSQKAQILSKILEGQSSIAELAEEFDIHLLVLTRWKNQAIQNLSKIFENEQKNTQKLKSVYEQQINELQEENSKLQVQLNWLKQLTISRLSKEARNELVTKDEAGLPIRTQTALLGLSRSTLYYQMNNLSVKKSKAVDHLSELKQLPLYLFAGLSMDQMKTNREAEVPKLRIQNGWMDVFGGYH